jgi:hypothetical protein
VRLSINNEVAFEPLDDVRLMCCIYITELKQTGEQTPGVAFTEHGAKKEGEETLQGVTRLQTSPRTSLLFVFHFVPSLNREREKKRGDVCV